MVNLHRIAGNAVSVLANDVVGKATTFVLYALVGRYLGAFEFGQLSLALTLFYTFQVLAGMGIKILVTRSVAKDTTKTAQYFINGSVIVFASSVLSLLILLLFMKLMNYAGDTTSIVVLLSFGLIPYSLSTICEAIFQAWDRMKYIAYANTPVNILKVGFAALLLSWGYELYQLIIVILGSYIATLCVEWWILLRHIVKPRLRIELDFMLAVIRSTSTFLGMDGITAIVGSFNYILLAKLVSETDVGLFNAATQLMSPVTLICYNVVLSIFPTMCRRFDIGVQSLQRISAHLIELLLAITVPIVVGSFFLADSALVILYGKQDFVHASGVLRIMVWGLILGTLTTVLGQVLVASMRERVILRIFVIDAVVNVVLTVIFITQFGLIGAAIAGLLAKVIDTLLHYVPVSHLISKAALGRLAWKPIVASLCMGVYLDLARSQEFLLSVVFAGIVYVGVLLALTLWSIGGPGQLKARYLYLWSE